MCQGLLKPKSSVTRPKVLAPSATSTATGRAIFRKQSRIGTRERVSLYACTGVTSQHRRLKARGFATHWRTREHNRPCSSPACNFNYPWACWLAGWLAGKEDGKICGRNGIRCGHVHETVLRDGPAHHRRGAEGLQSIKALTPAAISPPSRRLIEQQLASVCSGRSPPASGYFRSAPAAVVISRCIKIVCHPLNYSICSLY